MRQYRGTDGKARGPAKAGRRENTSLGHCQILNLSVKHPDFKNEPLCLSSKNRNKIKTTTDNVTARVRAALDFSISPRRISGNLKYAQNLKNTEVSNKILEKGHEKNQVKSPLQG